MKGETLFEDGWLQAAEKVTIEFELGEVRALVAMLETREPCAGRCGREECELLGYRATIGNRKLIDVLPVDTETIRDLRAAGTAGLDQWGASLVERGLL